MKIKTFFYLLIILIFFLSCKTFNQSNFDSNIQESNNISEKKDLFNEKSDLKNNEGIINDNLVQNKDNAKNENNILNVTLDINEKKGLLVFCSIPDKVLSKKTIYFLKKNMITGVVLFSNNIENEAQLRLLISELKEKVNNNLFIAIDQEGPEVSRIPWDETIKYSARHIGNNLKLDQIYNLYYKRSKLLLDLGINIILGPICDITNDKKSYIYSRSYGGDPEKVSEIIKTIVKAQKDAGIISVLKHFPGLGSTYTDTHLSIAEISKTINDLTNYEFKPFISGINAGAEMVLIGHIINREIDDNVSSLSFKYYEILKEIGFNGVVITDDLSMTGQLNNTIGWGINIITGERDFILNKINKILPDDNVCYKVYQLRNSLNTINNWSKK